MRFYLLKSFLLSVLSFWPVCVSAQPSGEPVKIGALMVLTGEFAMQGAAFREGVELAEQEVNDGGGVLGRPLRVIIEDTHSDPKLANSAAMKLISIDRVVAAITTSYPETEVGGAQFQKAGIPSMALWDSSPQIDAMGDYIFAIGPWAPASAESAASHAFRRLNARRAVVVNDVEPWSELVAGLFTASFEASGGKVVQRISLNPGEADFRTLIARIKAVQPDVLYSPLTNEIVPFYTQLFAAKFERPIVSSDIITEEHIAKNPAAFEHLYQAGIKDPARKETALLREEYTKRFHKPLTLPWFVATGHDAVKLYAEAIQRSGPEPEKIKNFLYTVKDFPGAAQSITISPGGSSPYPYTMFQVRGGKLVAIE